MHKAIAIKTIEITCERSPADCILCVPAFDDPIICVWAEFSDTGPDMGEAGNQTGVHACFGT
jgi:hypothetical protein